MIFPPPPKWGGPPRRTITAGAPRPKPRFISVRDLVNRLLSNPILKELDSRMNLGDIIIKLFQYVNHNVLTTLANPRTKFFYTKGSYCAMKLYSDDSGYLLDVTPCARGYTVYIGHVVDGDYEGMGILYNSNNNTAQVGVFHDNQLMKNRPYRIIRNI